MKLALWQIAGFPADVAANLAALEGTAQAAAAAGAALLLCPECWLCGYNIGDAVTALAEYSDGASAQRIAAIARQHGIAIAYGYAERDKTSRQLYNAVQVIGADGAVLSRYRKTHLFGPAERAAYQAGSQFEVPLDRISPADNSTTRSRSSALTGRFCRVTEKRTCSGRLNAPPTRRAASLKCP